MKTFFVSLIGVAFSSSLFAQIPLMESAVVRSNEVNTPGITVTITGEVSDPAQEKPEEDQQ